MSVTVYKMLTGLQVVNLLDFKDLEEKLARVEKERDQFKRAWALELELVKALISRAEKAEGQIADLLHRVKASIESNEAILKTSTDTGAMWRVSAYNEVLDMLLDVGGPEPDTFDYVMSDDDLHPDIGAAARKQDKR